MKNVFIMSALALSALFATSCSNRFEDVQVGGEATVTLTAQLPDGIQNHVNGPRRAAAKYGDGKTATTLDYAVYQVAADGAWTLMNDLSKTDEAINLSTTVKLQLVNGNTYAVVFWADAPTSIYTFDTGAMTVTADYDAAATDNEEYDAFYAVKTFTVNGASQETVELKRPFAQLNIGTADLAASEAAGVEVTKAGVKVNTYKTLNLKTGEVADPADVEFALAALPTGETFPVSGYEYLTMNYLLMPADKKADNTITISYDNTAAGTRTFNNVPLQRNYRTNIYGNLLTNSTDFNVVITPDFDGAENIDVWDGTSTVEPQKDADNNYLVSTAAEWAWLAKQNGRYIKSVGNKIYVTKDIDFGGYNVPSLDPGNNDVGISLDLIDGQGHKFSNILLDNNDGTNASLIRLRGTTVKNLTIENVTVKSTGNDEDNRSSVICASLQGGTLTIENVHIINANVTGVQSVAGFVGLVAQGCTVNISKSTIKNSTISNRSVAEESGFVAGFIGRVQGTATVTDCSAENTTVDAFYAVDEDHATNPRRDAESIQPIAVKEYASRVPAASLTITNTPETGVTVNKKELATVVTTAEGLAAAITAGKSDIQLAAGTYYLKGLTLTSDVTIVGTDAASTIVSLNLEAGEESWQEYFLDARGHKLTFNNVTYNQTGKVYAVIGAASGAKTAGSIFAKEFVMNNCICNGTVAVVADKVTLTGCDITDKVSDATEGYPVVVFGNDGCVINIDDCRINGVKKGLMLFAYQNAYKYDLTVRNSAFTITTADDKAAIEMHTEYGIYGNLTISNTTISGFPTTAGAGAGLWNEVVNDSDSAYGAKGTQTKRFKVTVDGVVKQNQVL